MRELKDRIYLFGMTRFTVGKLVAYRSDVQSIDEDADIDDIFEMKADDKERLASLQGAVSPFCFVAKCRRQKEELAVIFMRTFLDEYSIYTAAELTWSYGQVCAALSMQDTSTLCLSDDVLFDIKRSSDTEVKDKELLAYVKAICTAYEPVYWNRWDDLSPDIDTVSRISMEICELIGVQLTLDYNAFDEIEQDLERSKFSWKMYVETLELMSCIARKYSNGRMIGVILNQSGDAYRVNYLIDYVNDEARRQAERIIAKFMDMRGDAISYRSADTMEYTFIPAEPEIDFVGVKYDLFECYKHDEHQRSEE